MTVPIFIEQSEGQFCASPLGAPGLRYVRSSRAEAIAALKEELAKKIAAGELLDLEVQPLGVSGLVGRFQDDSALADICEQIYRERDAQRPR
jgi:hypothetical protein